MLAIMTDAEELAVRTNTWATVQEGSLCSYFDGACKQIFFLVVQKGGTFLDVVELDPDNRQQLLRGKHSSVKMMEFADLKCLNVHE